MDVVCGSVDSQPPGHRHLLRQFTKQRRWHPFRSVYPRIYSLHPTLIRRLVPSSLQSIQVSLLSLFRNGSKSWTGRRRWCWLCGIAFVSMMTILRRRTLWRWQVNRVSVITHCQAAASLVRSCWSTLGWWDHLRCSTESPLNVATTRRRSEEDLGDQTDSPPASRTPLNRRHRQPSLVRVRLWRWQFMEYQLNLHWLKTLCSSSMLRGQSLFDSYTALPALTVPERRDFGLDRSKYQIHVLCSGKPDIEYSKAA